MDAVTDRITRERIVEAGLRLLGEGGLHALAMRRIATELGIQQSALYWHFENKQQLLGAIADQVVAALAPAGHRHRDRLRSLATGLRNEVSAYPDGAELVATAFAFRLGARAAFDRFVAELVAAGAAADDAEVGASVLWHFVLGFVTDEQQHRQAAALGAIAAAPDDAARADKRFEKAVDLIVAALA